MQRFNVQGMTCGHCVKAVTSAIKDRDPSALVQIDLPTGEVIVESDLAAQEVVGLIGEEGYQAQVVQG
ncbi:copper resistance protein CopZ [Pseudomonas sp. S25]|uniref:Copper resistance protein CopZ n=1 Tax=Pseudomonas maioricensis TaxID=1766623 RepID=A0ABS9ZMH5_9PSED|nr:MULTISPECIES: heavy-metal-associated domain-containing protein [Pseudomonas]MCI8211769.1 copper resistance protein CopZ [Pseudomonas sp. S25]